MDVIHHGRIYFGPLDPDKSKNLIRHCSYGQNRQMEGGGVEGGSQIGGILAASMWNTKT